MMQLAFFDSAWLNGLLVCALPQGGSRHHCVSMPEKSFLICSSLKFDTAGQGRSPLHAKPAGKQGTALATYV